MALGRGRLTIWWECDLCRLALFPISLKDQDWRVKLVRQIVENGWWLNPHKSQENQAFCLRCKRNMELPGNLKRS
jgi:hypothetical protein